MITPVFVQELPTEAGPFIDELIGKHVAFPHLLQEIMARFDVSKSLAHLWYWQWFQRTGRHWDAVPPDPCPDCGYNRAER